MKLENKKDFASNVLGAGKGRIIFNKSRLSEIKEAMTRQDIRDLFASGAISIAEIKGRKKIEKRLTRRRAGSRRQPAIDKKRQYIITTRKLRAYLSELRKAEKIIVKKDAVILASAKLAQADILATLDKKHFFKAGVERFIKPAKIQTPKMLIEAVSREGVVE